jgi:hypothetical protein
VSPDLDEACDRILGLVRLCCDATSLSWYVYARSPQRKIPTVTCSQRLWLAVTCCAGGGIWISNMLPLEDCSLFPDQPNPHASPHPICQVSLSGRTCWPANQGLERLFDRSAALHSMPRGTCQPDRNPAHSAPMLQGPAQRLPQVQTLNHGRGWPCLAEAPQGPSCTCTCVMLFTCLSLRS